MDCKWLARWNKWKKEKETNCREKDIQEARRLLEEYKRTRPIDTTIR